MERVANTVSTHVAEVLEQAERESARIRARTDDAAARAGAEDIAELRREITERLERLRSLRTQLESRGRRIEARLRRIVADLAEIPTEPRSSGARDSDLERLLGVSPAGGDGNGGEPAHLLAVMKTAERAAVAMVEEARARARQAEAMARRDADASASAAAQRLGRVYESAAGSADTIKEQLTEVTGLMDASRGDETSET